ncbi:putative methyltransferase-domain-containing protein [Armillaria novae-zelandiae]|uniref:Methyltransferase-domain-containing protein n=1 Tax=Armillaria novae-zelandiae TaxID=153914 RepID=A0AA39PRW6_9AGAR|nr:putative methyltransferase-domain-containing protein [Armillaria novae-zelandiae]
MRLILVYSIDFARLVLEQLHFAAPTASLFDKTALGNTEILELGNRAGTGLLSIALSAWVKNYIVTDIHEILPLLEKNILLNYAGSADATNISIAELDWLSLHTMPTKQRSRVFQFPDVDLVLVVDCIYHPSLMPALVDAIDYLSTPGRTTVTVVVELRDEDAVRMFLELWLGIPGWEIWRIGRSNGLPRPYVIWVGRKTDGDNKQGSAYEGKA